MKIMAICMVPLMARSGRRLATKLPTNVITSTPMSSGRLFLTSRFLCFLYGSCKRDDYFYIIFLFNIRNDIVQSDRSKKEPGIT